ncbi:MAG TPA: alpha/beta fold hydrolase [Gaiellaceae bacterium]|jgi:pimeloyl-ACP methyl ester carboxylesterase|nr:alpha/beta fold hydrolase [Gaiellaceae bacterium]
MTESKPGLEGFESRVLDVRAARVRYDVGGDGAPLVLVHGFAGAASNFAVLAPLLARRHRLLVPDLPGHGGSGSLAAAPTLAGFADCVAAVLEHERTGPAAVVGHSMGGVVALRLAVRRPELVRGIVLAASAGISTTTRLAEVFLTAAATLQPGRRIALWRERIARSPRLRALAFDGFSTSDAAAMSPQATLGFLAGSRQYTDIWSAGRALVREDVRLDLERVRCPALVLAGARDRQVPIDDAFEYARRLRASLRTIADCGHLLVGERPEACADAIERFLELSG